MRLGDAAIRCAAPAFSAAAGARSAGVGVEGHKGFALGQFTPGRSTPRRRRTSSWGDMYAKCGSMEDSRRVFDSILHPNVMSLMLGYVSNGESDVALDLFERMQAKLQDAAKACSSLAAKEDAVLVDGKLVKEASLETGRGIHSQAKQMGPSCSEDVFLSMREEAVDVDGKLVKRKRLETEVAIHGEASNSRYCENVFVGNTLIDMYAKCEKLEEARRVFDGMAGRSSEPPVPREDGKLVRIQSLEKGMEIHSLAAKFGRWEQLGGHHLRPSWKESRLSFTGVGWKTIKLWGVNFYRKCGVMSAAEHLFGSLAVRDIVAWNALVTGFGQQGDTSRVFEAFREMREDGVRANAITFVSVITACSHGGIVERGREFFQAMDPDSGIVCGIHHYSSLVDLIDENDSAAYVLMASIYRSAGLWEDHDKLKTIQEAALKADKKSSLHQAVTRW
ncbi:pentatricopeptide repeat-containing protein At2g13600-like [Selaginella moellendorffii]|uniref:pentatricopeptide repeat-containing protein At2g13600-like n=1 Tax=Selaginella moellendorffii TaxID=88036 RepID=UPI000D1D0668|nr:pentatricopeptide repeat-containing protein At2g13600-like [Selaginella moellendorffii]|eukprot:XP_024542076.1 pentatricopeptide repeat-containing protein At2g13600-like [Selaginella moellendorffii]